MQFIKLVDRQIIASASNGDFEDNFARIETDVLAAKNASLYVLVHDVDDDGWIKIGYRHTPNGTDFIDGSATLYDSTDIAGGVPMGMKISSAATDVTQYAKIVLVPKIGTSTGGAADRKKATISVWLVAKPF